jgi:hypothetical protein
VSPIRTEPVDRAKHRLYLQKALEFFRAAEAAEAAADWNATTLNSVHAVISAADALTAYFLGKRSRSDRHEDVARLLLELTLPGAAERADLALGVLRLKNAVEYEARLIAESEAVAARKRAGRFVLWARQCLEA